VCSTSSKEKEPIPSADLPRPGETQDTKLPPSDATVVAVSSAQSNPPHGIDNSPSTKRGHQGDATTARLPPAKRSKPTAQNFLLIGAKRAKELKSARNAARVGCTPRNEGKKISHTGSGVPLARVLCLKYVKGFTEAVRKPCKLQDLT
jgi:hypothetical protein